MPKTRFTSLFFSFPLLSTYLHIHKLNADRGAKAREQAAEAESPGLRIVVVDDNGRRKGERRKEGREGRKKEAKERTKKRGKEKKRKDVI